MPPLVKSSKQLIEDIKEDIRSIYHSVKGNRERSLSTRGPFIRSLKNLYEDIIDLRTVSTNSDALLISRGKGDKHFSEVLDGRVEDGIINDDALDKLYKHMKRIFHQCKINDPKTRQEIDERLINIITHIKAHRAEILPTKKP